MKLDRDKLAQPARKLGELLKNLRAVPTPDEVHSIRTQTRRMEAAIQAMGAGTRPSSKRLMKLLAPVRKAAGAVRDSDVMIQQVMDNLNRANGDTAAVRLTEHLASERFRDAERLLKLVNKRGPVIRQKLKNFLTRVKKRVRKNPRGLRADRAAWQVTTTALELWPRLNDANLHGFRIEVKKLLYMLRFAQGNGKSRTMGLDKAKDAIGAWHDWQQLRGIAAEILHPKKDRRVLKQVNRIADAKFRAAMTAGKSVRAKGVIERAGEVA